MIVATLCLLAPQQFVLGKPLPGEARWSEGVECTDVENDGDLDIFFAEGDGFHRAGEPRQNILIINRLIETGEVDFADESVARLGEHATNAKMVFTGDIDADGYVDAIFANAFRTSPPCLYVNRGLEQPGFFTERAVERGLAEPLSSASGQFGDVDDDGDLDLILCDSGESFLGGDGGVPRLYLNDGAGYFTEETGPGWQPARKIAHMDVQLVDLDGDFDLDFFGTNRGANQGGTHYVMLNDGNASFDDVSHRFPATSTLVYEVEFGDLDGDRDLDCFLTSMTAMTEGAVRNDTSEGDIVFLPGATLTGSHDDNEVMLLDYDSDGDLDPIVASLGVREALWRNDGGFAFTKLFEAVEGIRDSSMDATVADLDNDGDYDLVTAQGESNRRNWANRVLWNEGPKDDLAPQVLALEEPRFVQTGELAGEWRFRVQVQDQVSDDGVMYLSANLLGGLVPKGRGSLSQEWIEGTYSGGGVFRFALPAQDRSERRYVLVLGDWAGNDLQLPLRMGG